MLCITWSLCIRVCNKRGYVVLFLPQLSPISHSGKWGAHPKGCILHVCMQYLSCRLGIHWIIASLFTMTPSIDWFFYFIFLEGVKSLQEHKCVEFGESGYFLKLLQRSHASSELFMFHLFLAILRERPDHLSMFGQRWRHGSECWCSFSNK